MYRMVFFFILVMNVAVPVMAEELLILQSLRTRNYREVVKAATSACDVSAREIFMSEIAEVNVPRVIRESRAKAVLAVGDTAFKAAIRQRHVPVVGALTLEMQQLPANAKAIPYLASQQKYLQTFRTLGKKNIGMVYDGKLSTYVAQADRMAKGMGIHLELREVNRTEQVGEALASLQRTPIDALWVIPDTNVEPLLKLAAVKQIPAVVFSKAYLKTGAVLAIEPDRTFIGKRAGELVCKAIIDGWLPAQIASNTAYITCGNIELAQRLGLPGALFSQACSN